MTVGIPQADGTSIPVDISVTGYVPTVYHHFVHLLEQYGIVTVPNRFSYSVRYGDGVYAHDLESALKDELRADIERFRRLLAMLRRFTFLSSAPSRARAALNPFNYVPMSRLLDAYGISADFRNKILKPLFVNLVLASGVFDMPASLFARYLDFFDIEKSTPMVTWDQGTANLYGKMSAGFSDRIHLSRGVSAIVRDQTGVLVRDEAGREERFDEVVLACNANQALAMLTEPTRYERWLLGSIRYESERHGLAVVHSDPSVLAEDAAHALDSRTNYVEHCGARPDSYEITYVMHNQQPWAKRSDRPCLVTYNAVHPIDEARVWRRCRFQHVVHDVFHFTVLMSAFQLIQGRRHTWYCGAHTTLNSQEHCFISGLAVAYRLGADYPWPEDPVAAAWFGFWGRSMFGRRFREVRRIAASRPG